MALVNGISYARRGNVGLKALLDACTENSGMHEVMKKARREVHRSAARNIKACGAQYNRRL